MFQGRRRGAPSVSKRSSKGVSMDFQGSFTDVLSKLQVCLECVNEVLFYDFVVAWISSQLPEQKEGLFST